MNVVYIDFYLIEQYLGSIVEGFTGIIFYLGYNWLMNGNQGRVHRWSIKVVKVKLLSYELSNNGGQRLIPVPYE